ncbi:MAG: hypothetical protein ACYC6G_08890 [Desulfobaccales bacterium]
MEDYSGHIRGLINDLLRSLSAALIHLDDLMLKIDKNSDMFPDVCLTNEQLERSVEVFVELRSQSNHLFEHLSAFDDNYEHINIPKHELS